MELSWSTDWRNTTENLQLPEFGKLAGMWNDRWVGGAAPNALAAKIPFVGNYMKLLQVRVSQNLGFVMLIKSSSAYTQALILYHLSYDSSQI